MLEQGQLKKDIQAVSNGNDAACRLALQSLKAHKEDDWAGAPAAMIQSLIEVLRRQLTDHPLLKGAKQPSIHKDAAVILGNLGMRAKSAIPQLVELLQAGIPDPIREAAAVALGKIGREAKSAVPDLITLINGRTSLSIQAIRALGEIGCADQRVRAALTEHWAMPAQTPTGQVQIACAISKLKIDAPNVAAILTGTLMTSQDAALRKSAAEALAWRNKDETDVVPALLAASLSDKNEDVQNVAKAGLEQMKLTPDKAIPICARQLKESHYAEPALRKSGVQAVPALVEALKASDAAARMKAARILATFGESAVAAVAGLTAALRDKDAEVRLAAAKGLWNVSKQADLAVPVLINLLQEKGRPEPDGEDARRMFLQTVIEALWRIGPDANSAVPALVQKAKDKNRLVSESAREALKKIAPAMMVK